MKKNMAPVWVGLVVLESAMWGVGNPVMKVALETLTPFWLLTLRFGIAFVLLAVVFGRRTLATVNRRTLPGIMLSGVMNAACYAFATFCLSLSTATIAGFLMSLAVIFTPFLAFVFLRQRPDWRFYPLVAVVVAGTYLLCGSGGAFVFGPGELLGVLSSLTFAAALIATSRLVGEVGATAMTTVQIGTMALSCLIVALLTEDWRVLPATGGAGWLAVLYLAVGCSFAAYLLQNVALKHLSPVPVSLAFSSEPIFTALTAYIMLGERLDTGGYIGAALIMLGIALASVVRQKPKAGPEGPPSA